MPGPQFQIRDMTVEGVYQFFKANGLPAVAYLNVNKTKLDKIDIMPEPERMYYSGAFRVARLQHIYPCLMHQH